MTGDEQCFAVLYVAVYHWHELMPMQHIMWLSTAQVSGQFNFAIVVHPITGGSGISTG